MKVWITKYALRSGIFSAEVEEEDENDTVVVRNDNSLNPYYHGDGREWHRTKESAIAKAEDMRKKKITSLKKQIEKLENMEFDTEK